MIEEIKERIEILEKREVEIGKELKELYKQLKKAKEREFDWCTDTRLKKVFMHPCP